MRAGLFCTTAVKHLIGHPLVVRCGQTACSATSSQQGGVVIDDAIEAREAPDRGRPEPCREQAQAQRSLIANLQTQAQMDTANIMARYGTRLRRWPLPAWARRRRRSRKPAAGSLGSKGMF
jgi:hypothetical protein